MKRKLITGVAAATMLATTAVPVTNNLSFTKQAKPQKVAAATTPQAFLEEAVPLAQKASRKYGLYPSVMLAQAIVESDWGQSTLATQANNLFGIKDEGNWYGNSYQRKTREESATGKSYFVNAAFRKYNSYAGSFDDNGKKLREGVSWQPMRYSGAWVENASSYEAATKALTGTYATDHRYNVTLDSRISQYDLSKYDPKISKTVKSYIVAKSGSTYAWPTDHSVSAKTSGVKKGDSVTVDKTITFHSGLHRMHIAGKGWVDGSTFKKGSALPAAVTQAPKGTVKTNKNIMHNAVVYNKQGHVLKNVTTIKADNVIPTYGTKTINGKKYYRIGKQQYIAAGNVDGTMRLLKRNAHVDNQYANRDNSQHYQKGQAVNTYGKAVTILGKKYYKVGIHQYILKANFAK